MALIEYRILVDPNGNFTVLQDVKEIGPGDKIRFVSNDPDVAVQYSPDQSPFLDQSGAIIPAEPINSAGRPLDVVRSNATAPQQLSSKLQETRKTFSFQCGRTTTGKFEPWGTGAQSPDGGSSL